MYSASQIAYAFAKKGIDEGNPITQMKLQKIVFFAQGYHLATFDEPLIKETFQAWKFGPVVPSLYRDYKAYGSRPITDLDWIRLFCSDDVTNINFDPLASETISYTWESTKDVSALTLSNWTHQEGTPWQKAFNPVDSDIVIPNDEIKKYFRVILKKA